MYSAWHLYCTYTNIHIEIGCQCIDDNDIRKIFRREPSGPQKRRRKGVKILYIYTYLYVYKYICICIYRGRDFRVVWAFFFLSFSVVGKAEYLRSACIRDSHAIGTRKRMVIFVYIYIIHNILQYTIYRGVVFAFINYHGEWPSGKSS